MPFDEHDESPTMTFPLLGDLSPVCEELFFNNCLPLSVEQKRKAIEDYILTDVPALLRGLNTLCGEKNKAIGLDFENDIRLRKDFLIIAKRRQITDETQDSQYPQCAEDGTATL
eukprot:PhF_6_TR33722/c1_g3_i3/m.49513